MRQLINGATALGLLLTLGGVAHAITFANQTVTTQAPPATGCTAPPAVTSFLTTDNTVYLYFEATVSSGDALTNDWLAPDGSIHSKGSWPSGSGHFCFTGGTLSIGNTPPNLLGGWQARVFDNGTVLFTIAFSVSASGSGVTFTANPNPIVTNNGSQLGKTTLSWNAPGHNRLAIFVGSATGAQMTGALGASGTAQTGNWVTDGMPFFLVDLDAGTAIASLTVHVTTGSGPPGSGVSFTANPNPITTANGATVGMTTLSWNAPGYSQVAIFVGSASGVQMTGAMGPSGSAQTGNWVSDGMQFFLVDLTGGTAIASLTVHVDAGSGPPSGGISFTANPNPIPTAAAVGMTTLNWNAPGYNRLAIFVGSASGAQMTGTLASSGSAQTGNWVTDGMQFFLVDLNSGSAIANLTVHLGGSPGPGSGITITSLSSTSSLPLMPLYIQTSGLDVTSPVTIAFSDGAGFAMTQSAMRVDPDGTVLAAVPLYANANTGQTSSGTVSVVLSQGGQSTPPMTLAIQDLPSVSSYGAQPGEISHAALVFHAMLLGSHINQLQAFQALPGNTVDTSQSRTALRSMLNAVIQARSDIDRVAADGSVVIPGGALPNGTPMQFDQTSLDLMDRINGLIFSQTFGTLPQASGSAALPPGKRARVWKRFQLMTSQGMPAAHGRRFRPEESGAVSWLKVIQTFTGGAEIVNGAESLQKSKDWIDRAQAAATALSGFIDALPSSTATSEALGAAGALVSDVQVIGETFAQLGAYIDGLATGNQALVNVAVQAMTDNQSKLRSTYYDLAAALTGETAVSTIYNFVKAYSELGAETDAADDTSLEIANEYPSPFPSDLQGIAMVDGNVSVPNSNGAEAAQSQVQITSDLTDSFSTVADPGGSYQLYVPLQDPNFDYANADLQIVDPLTLTTLGSEGIDISGLTTSAPLDAPIVTGSGCVDDDASSPDGDDPDCDSTLP